MTSRLHGAARRGRALLFWSLVCLAASSATLGRGASAAEAPAPAGVYVLDPTHASLIFRVDHLGFSRYTARFKRFDAELRFDPADPTACAVTASVEVASLETDFPDPAYDFNAQLTGPEWLDAARHPQMTFRTRRVEPTGPSSARVHGDFTLRGVTRPVILEAAFNGGYAGHPLDPGGSRIGFSARGSLLRSAFGIDLGIPPPGSSMGVGDAVEFIIEAEFLRPRDEPAKQ